MEDKTIAIIIGALIVITILVILISSRMEHPSVKQCKNICKSWNYTYQDV